MNGHRRAAFVYSFPGLQEHTAVSDLKPANGLDQNARITVRKPSFLQRQQVIAMEGYIMGQSCLDILVPEFAEPLHFIKNRADKFVEQHGHRRGRARQADIK